MTEQKMAPGGAEGETNHGNPKLRPNRTEVKTFLRDFGRGRPTLSFKGDHGLMTRVYPNVASAASAAVWFNEHGCEVYFVGNSHRMAPGAKRKILKPSKSDIVLSVGVWVDVDGVGNDPSVVSDLRSFLDQQPAYIVGSGGGQQAFWRLAEYTYDTEAVENANRWLITELAKVLGWDRRDGTDGVDKQCWTRDHLWRLPGTVNHKRGRNAKLLFRSDERVPLDELGQLESNVSRGGEFTVGDYEWVTDEWIQEVFPPYLLDALWSDGRDRSVHVYRFLRKFFEAFGTEQLYQEAAVAILMIPTDDPRLVSHHSYFQRKGNEFIPRCSAKAEALRQVQKWITKESGNA